MHSTGSLSAFSQEGNKFIICCSAGGCSLDCLLVIITVIICLAPFTNFKHPRDMVYNTMLLEHQPAASRQEMVHSALPSVLAQIACLHNMYKRHRVDLYT